MAMNIRPRRCCRGRDRLWCLLDHLTRCRVRRVCDKHERAIWGCFK